jgi:hypothetical protein
MAALDAKQAAAARGMSPQMQLQKARLAWKSTSPKVKRVCTPAATKAAQAEVANPGKPKRKMANHRFVRKCKQVMKAQVKAKCMKATTPLVKAGAKKAALHDADYKWQVKEGLKECVKVCNANSKMFAHNAEKQCNSMIQRTLSRKAASDHSSLAFARELRSKVKDKIERRQKAAVRKAVEKVEKKCALAKKKAARAAKEEASRKAVRDETAAHVEAAGKAAQSTAYKQALQDGLSVAHAKKLGAAAYKRKKREALARANVALKGLAPAKRLVLKHAAEVEQLNLLEVVPQQQTQIHLEKTMKALDHELTSNDKASQQDAVASINEALLERNAHHPGALVHSIAKGVRLLHKLGGELPSEMQSRKLQLRLKAAQTRIAKLKAARQHV